VVLLLDPDTGAPTALLDGTRLTELRTGAIVGSAIQCLSPHDRSVIGIIGSGALARASVEVLRAACGLERVVIYSRSPANREAFAGEIANRHGVAIEICQSPEEVLAATRVILCATATGDPVFPGQALRSGSLVISIGANTPDTRELDVDTMRAGTVIVESRETALSECGEFIIPISQGLFGSDIIRAEIGEILAGSQPKPKDRGTVIFKSTGLAVQDLLVAQELVRRAEKLGTAERISLS
jgi:ornithine cyclodeaminase/alanine dehydrogenase-like protein (mu-crystallin family)